MSCGTCPESSQIPARSSAMSGGQVMLGWAVDVEQWFRQRQAQGQRPVISAAPPAPAEAAAPLSVQRPLVPSRFSMPKTIAEGAAAIQETLQDITDQPFRATVFSSGFEVLVEPPPDRPLFSPEECRSWSECLGVTKRERIGPIWICSAEGGLGIASPSAPRWPAVARRLLSIRAAQDLLRVAGQKGRWQPFLRTGPALKAKAMLSTRTDEQSGEVEVQLTACWEGLPQLMHCRLNAQGELVEHTEPLLPPMTGEAAIQELRADRYVQGALHCLSCGYALGERKSCPHCGTSWDAWHPKRPKKAVQP